MVHDFGEMIIDIYDEGAPHVCDRGSSQWRSAYVHWIIVAWANTSHPNYFANKPTYYESKFCYKVDVSIADTLSNTVSYQTLLIDLILLN